MIYAAVAVVVLGALLLGARRARRDPVQRVSVEGPRPWAGPSRLNGRPALRLPASIPRPVQQLEEEARRGDQ